MANTPFAGNGGLKKDMPDRPDFQLELADLADVLNHMTTNKKTTRVGSLFHVYLVGPNYLPPFAAFKLLKICNWNSAEQLLIMMCSGSLSLST